jgi:hypothetical protein
LTDLEMRASACVSDTDTLGAVSADDSDWDPVEHVRLARYRRMFDEVTPADAAALTAQVLTDPDKGMANSAVCEYLDRRAAELLTDPGYPAWRLEMTGPGRLLQTAPQ